MPEITAALVAVVMGAGAVAGCLGALLGIGGGVFLVPFVDVVLGLGLTTARGISIMTVIATSSVVAADSSSRPLVNMRLAMLLLIAASAGGLIGGITVVRLPYAVLSAIFALVTGVIAILMVSRLDRRNVILDPAADPGHLGGRFHENESGGQVVYKLKRLHLATIVSVVGGYVSGILGIGGGILQVPALNAWCGVPIRAAAATSAVMIGVTAAASAPIFYGRGDINPPLAAAAVIGVLGGSQFGFWIGGRARARWLKLLMAIVLGIVSVTYFRRVFA
jgi:uncharacterized membrane protein YfcA